MYFNLNASKKFLVTLVLLALLMPITYSKLQAQQATPTPEASESAGISTEADTLVYVKYNDVEWQPCEGLPGCEVFVLRGDQQTGPSESLWRIQPSVQIPAHWHTTPEHLIGLTGTMIDIDENGQARTFGLGDFIYAPSKTVHSFVCAGQEACVLYSYDELPLDVHLHPEEPAN